MLRISNKIRFYCKIAAKSDLKSKLDFTQLRHPTKVPQQPEPNAFPDLDNNTDDDPIDSKTIQLLERLSLVDLDSEEALKTLKSSIQFANRIVDIPTENVPALYTVLEKQQLQLRNDSVTEGNCRQEILRNAKITDEDYFVSPPGNIPLEQQNE
ncbi:glutamyl-tRNA(Gln) amidotransferase subunit C, mitochondrial [Drosophila willistoni]|uniref:Glutamyl-tRNA(Gln) amidotransferase subunit C, mitochondrial n=1 Tax=Drosophila willistoni TaxID=7260 RepID=GATC_DROWI|nr:glutamyl-tRNA(Gln) amidotransferase subunit C, mitochondrial [Drosophila willistoni]B4MVR2.1 RecName: Full=Glutamyl-tRNA(Gln) amidotransferase subunit C, mitochondrial; Short=Glu-AdT subunit C [Drosophila willistoni]